MLYGKKELELLIENFPDKPVLRRYKTYIENKGKSFTKIHNKYVRETRNAIKNKHMWASVDELDVITDIFRKSVRNIEERKQIPKVVSIGYSMVSIF